MGYHFIFNRPLELIGIAFQQFNLLNMPVESLHVLFEIGFDSFPEYQESQINVIKKLINLQDEILCGPRKYSHNILKLRKYSYQEEILFDFAWFAATLRALRLKKSVFNSLIIKFDSVTKIAFACQNSMIFSIL